jgi:hypothetical protein
MTPHVVFSAGVAGCCLTSGVRETALARVFDKRRGEHALLPGTAVVPGPPQLC